MLINYFKIYCCFSLLYTILCCIGLFYCNKIYYNLCSIYFIYLVIYYSYRYFIYIFPYNNLFINIIGTLNYVILIFFVMPFGLISRDIENIFINSQLIYIIPSIIFGYLNNNI